MALKPTQTSLVAGVTMQSGFGFTINLPWQVVVQPSASTMVTMYKPASASCASGIRMVWLVEVKPFGPVQLKRYGSVPLETPAVKVAANPAQISLDAGVTTQIGLGFTIIRPW